MRIVLAALLLAVSAAASWAETLYVYSSGDGYLNLRTGPGGGYPVAREMYHGDAVEVLYWGDGWHQVMHGSGAVGWASSRYLQPDPERTVMIVNSPGDGYLNLRQGPTSYDPIIGRMYHLDEVLAVGRRSGAWLLVEHVGSGWQGWAHSRFLTAP